jgi:hypothetical protein
MAKDVVATYTLITKAAITIAELMSTYLHLYIKAIPPPVCIKYFLPTEASEPLLFEIEDLVENSFEFWIVCVIHLRDTNR